MTEAAIYLGTEDWEAAADTAGPDAVVLELPHSPETPSAETPNRPPKVTPEEAAFLLARGPYMGRLAAEYTRLRYALDNPDFEIPDYAIESIRHAINRREIELANFEDGWQWSAAEGDNQEPEASVELIERHPDLQEPSLKGLQDLEPPVPNPPAVKSDETRPTTGRTILPSAQVTWLVDESLPLRRLSIEPQFVAGLSAQEQAYMAALNAAEDLDEFTTDIKQRSLGDEDFDAFAFGLVQKVRTFRPSPSQPAPQESSNRSAARREVAAVLTNLIDPDAEPLPWQEEALCAQTDPEAFFPEKGGSTREAKRVCNKCEVRGDCLSYSLTHEERFGIWGGLSERERRRLRRSVR